MKIKKISFLLIFLTLNLLSVCSENTKKRKRPETESDIETETNKKIKLDPKEQQDLNDRFINAAKHGFLELMERLYNQGAQIDGLHSDRDCTALMASVLNDDIKIFNYLMRKRANINIFNETDGSTALTLALKYKYFNIARALILNRSLNIDYTYGSAAWIANCYLTDCCKYYRRDRVPSYESFDILPPGENLDNDDRYYYLEFIDLLLRYGANPITPRVYPKIMDQHTFLDYVRENPEISEVYNEFLNNQKITQELLDRHLPCLPTELNALIVSYVKEPSVKKTDNSN